MGRLLLVVAAACAAYFLVLGPGRAARTTVGRWLIGATVVVLALLYLRSPIDVIPDGTGLVGFLDDALLIAYVVWWLRGRASLPGREEKQPRSASAHGATWDPYAVLGVSRDASREEVSAAYRRRMKEYHPDRVNDLGEDLRRVAHEKTLEIQRAYEELRGR
jgi:uncharacterized membrane protein YkvA (DUF1232 family)